MAVTAPEKDVEEDTATGGLARGTLVALVVVVACGAGLRLWDLGASRLSIDESYTAMAARLPAGDLVRHIDATDPHGPLAYLLLRPVAAFTTDLGALRMVSAVASIGALVIMAIWQRRAGVAGLVTTAVFALSPFQLVYGRQVRMYGLLVLAGVTAAWAANRWLDATGRGWAVLAAVAGLVAALSHGTGVLLLVCLLAIPLLRRDRDAWEFRIVCGSALALFGVVWGAHVLRWSHDSGGLPTATPSWLSIVMNETIAPIPDQRWLVLGAAVAGGAVLCRAGGPRARVWCWLFLAPVAVLYGASLSRGVLIPKSLMPFSWGLPLALGALVGWVWTRWRPVAVVAVAALLLAVVPYVGEALRQDEGSGAATDVLFAARGDDEGVVVRASEWQTDSLVLWNGIVAGGAGLEPVGQRVGDLVLYRAAAAPDSSRALYVTMDGGVLPADVVPCGPERHLGGALTTRCVDLRSVGPAEPTG